MHPWFISLLCLLGGFTSGLGLGVLIGVDVTRERMLSELREQRLRQFKQRHGIGGHS